MLRVQFKEARLLSLPYKADKDGSGNLITEYHRFVPGINELENEVWDSIWSYMKNCKRDEVVEIYRNKFSVIHDDKKEKSPFNAVKLSQDKLLEYVEACMDEHELKQLKKDLWKAGKRSRVVRDSIDHKIEKIEAIHEAYAESRR